MNRTLSTTSATLALALGLSLAVAGCGTPAPVPVVPSISGSSSSVSTTPSSSPTPTTAPSSGDVNATGENVPLRGGLTTVAGTQVMKGVSKVDEDKVRGWFATLSVNRSATESEVLNAYRAQLKTLGYAVSVDNGVTLAGVKKNKGGGRSYADVSISAASGEISSYVRIIVTTTPS